MTSYQDQPQPVQRPSSNLQPNRPPIPDQQGPAAGAPDMSQMNPQAVMALLHLLMQLGLAAGGPVPQGAAQPAPGMPPQGMPAAGPAAPAGPPNLASILGGMGGR